MDDLPTTGELPRPDHQTPAWMLRARCREAAPGAFFPSDGVGVERARRVCAECPVQTECLEYALEFRIDHGVWGGCSERERRRILRQRRLTASR
ncbi:MAG TPA: WhiB family transcriptional regulator [Acidimicrobiia bacterium]